MNRILLFKFVFWFWIISIDLNIVEGLTFAVSVPNTRNYDAVMSWPDPELVFWPPFNRTSLVWTSPQLCPRGYFVNGIKNYYDAYMPSDPNGDNAGLCQLGIKCHRRSINAYVTTDSVPVPACNSSRYVHIDGMENNCTYTAYGLKIWYLPPRAKITNDEMGVLYIKPKCCRDNDKENKLQNEFHNDTKIGDVVCPNGMGSCGISVLQDVGVDDSAGIVGLKLFCCKPN